MLVPTRPHTHRSEFALRDDTVLPDVDLVFSYSGSQGPQYDHPPAGLVVTATNLSCNEMLTVQVLARKGSPVVVAFPTGERLGRLRPVEDTAPDWVRQGCPQLAGDRRWDGTWIPPLPAPLLTPQKARILLMLALSQTRERADLERIFMRY